ncbi:hypothetical protein [Cyclobacterium plantarum]|uniref:hypothetical protein n=1 Tax=Cyclobacterium plantarum TaxID=2716263 RepID=UPI003F702253
MESLPVRKTGVNAMLIHQGMEQPERLTQLNQMAITQITSLLRHKDQTKKLNT